MPFARRGATAQVSFGKGVMMNSPRQRLRQNKANSRRGQQGPPVGIDRAKQSQSTAVCRSGDRRSRGQSCETKPICRCAPRWTQAGGTGAWGHCAKQSQFAGHGQEGPSPRAEVLVVRPSGSERVTNKANFRPSGRLARPGIRPRPCRSHPVLWPAQFWLKRGFPAVTLRSSQP